MRDLIQYAIPGFIILLVAEVILTARQQKDYYDVKDTAGSLTMGIGNVIVGIVGKMIVFGTYSLVYQFRLFTVDMTQVWAWIVLFFADDFSYYWFHRISHSSRYFWASHVVHHSSQKYNLGTALRQTWTGTLSGAFLFWIWLPLVGFSPIAVMTMQAVSLLYQFWIHTEHIDKLPAPIEYIFNTPSHHRVHHGSNLAYLDKNHAGILIIWDRLFGTFAPEQQRPTYGLTTNIDSHNPIRIAFHEWTAIGRDVSQAGSLRNALGYIFGPPGWSHDGSRRTTKQLRNEEQKKSGVLTDSI
ncbi:sterol desaturase family protein [Spirosoma utsteinense]|uniref:Sterol desaturase/sphingolipid hydroxylase (Fatty acid hydroxylase superfamily) n=1 Tax=Spirosoma utsteinense TaxID=2585773 RepID=A0ABR6VZI0_9BACT|nr:sterol desaturase family protein [Spirosoma utsteinense]MBC3784507.1 sterol desaturase/sphingolipid hydroxylase (fatty acid hydroxylase superfamily) [Spirosoma utsteinense]MBC3789742.1 sterol desaturase/sphingolipid hydroxylase (fatty acid hydroxylase superfamily) [Spirosoma utsteinense]